MTKEVINIHIADLLERIQSVERLINMYKKSGDDVIALSMIKQYTIRKEEFVERLTHLRKKTLKLEQIPVSKKAYTYEPVLLSAAHEPVSAYGKKDESIT